jgi:hypothetical protein
MTLRGFFALVFWLGAFILLAVAVGALVASAFGITIAFNFTVIWYVLFGMVCAFALAAFFDDR